MSKSQLKKELESMSREQLTEMLLDAYSARKEFKEYFEYFLNPDEEKLFGRYADAAVKELARSKYGRSKARISRLKRIVTDFEGFQPSLASRLDLMLCIFRTGVLSERSLHLPPTLTRGLEYFMLRAVDAAGQYEEQVLSTITETLKGDGRTSSLRRYLSEALEARLSQVKLIKK